MGIFATFYHFTNYLTSNIAASLNSLAIVVVLVTPLLTMRIIAEERQRKTDQLLYSLPISVTSTVVAKYLAMVTVFLIPMLVVCVYPFVMSAFGIINFARTFGSMDALMNASLETLTEVPDIGAITAQNIVEWFAQPQSAHMIQRLREAGVNFVSKRTVEDARFAGMTFVLTGALSKFTRDEATDKIELFGGKVSGSVSKKTSFVVVGENAGSKEKKARELNITILSEDEFLEMIQ
jgi:hypothetical protein